MLGKAELLSILEKNGIPFSYEHHESVLNMKESEKLRHHHGSLPQQLGAHDARL